MARAMAYLRESGARWAVPFAGPACFLADDLEHLNDLTRDASNPFPDLATFLEVMQAEGMRQRGLLVPRHPAGAGRRHAVGRARPAGGG